MTLWSIQPENVWELLRKTGVLRTTWGNIGDDWCRRPYRWLITQMKERIGCPPGPDCVPVWAWYQWESRRRSRPDLRAVRWWHSRGERCVRIEFTCSPSEVLLSDYDLWHHVLNNWYLSCSESDDKVFEARWGFPNHEEINANPALRREIEVSWARIFDLDREDDYSTVLRSEKSIQATLWQIELKSVVGVTPFVGSRLS